MTRKSTKSADQTSRKECDHVRNGTVVVQKSLGFLSVSNFKYGPASFIQAIQATPRSVCEPLARLSWSDNTIATDHRESATT